MKRFFFAYYGWLAACLWGAAAVSAWLYAGDARIALMGAAIGGTLVFCYFVQRQKFSETELFHRLFTEFNARYASLNGELAAMVG
jgi:hypothetical protein